jgi:small-conductance mechanosensitive channel
MEQVSPALPDQNAGIKESLEGFAAQLTRLVGMAWERITGVPQEVEQALAYRELWIYALTSAALFALIIAVLPVISAFIGRKIRRRRRRYGDDDARALVLEAVKKPLALAGWVYGIYFSALPLLLLVEPGDLLFPVRLLCQKIFDFGLVIAIYWFLYRSVHAAQVLLRSWSQAPAGSFQDLLIHLAGKTLRVVIPLAGALTALQMLHLPQAYRSLAGHTSSLLIIGAISWMLFQIVDVAAGFILARYNLMAADNLRARQVHTQVQILKNTLYVVIGVFALASALMLFEQVRGLGASVLASAGVAGIVIGFAAQRTIANLFAGFQLALTQPIRMDDVVIVEDEFGRIEEITLTYVVVRIWDMRRLIVPLSYFIERPFQNWTRHEADILGTVFLYTDYTVAVDALRAELKRIVAASSEWDGKVCVLQVTNATEKALELRALASAADASKAWNLRCEIRERLIDFVQKNYPGSLPRVRAEFDSRPEK